MVPLLCIYMCITCTYHVAIMVDISPAKLAIEVIVVLVE